MRVNVSHMRDFKDISAKDGSTLRKLRRKPSTNAFKALIEPRERSKRLRVILPVFAALLAAYPLASLLFSAKTAVSSVRRTDVEKPRPYAALDPYQSLQIAADSLKSCRAEGERLQARLPDGGTVVYAINRELQERVERVMAEKSVPYGAFVAIEPKTGKILAMVAHSSANPSWEQRSCFDLYPMASLFKIVTASAALEQKKITPDTVFQFRGGLHSENPRYWEINPRGRNQQIPLNIAMGKSVNPVYGRLASDVVGKESMMRYAQLFGFNQTLFPNTQISPSRAAAPQNDRELKLMGSGLGREVKISPIHAAAVMAAIANNGVMMTPALAEEVKNGEGKVVFSHKAQPMRKLLEPETTRQLGRMLATTVNSGTSRRAFHDRRGRAKLAAINIAAKTGSINGKDPAGHYSWFAAYAPAEDPEIALVALVINGDKWKIKASHVGEQALEAFFK